MAFTRTATDQDLDEIEALARADDFAPLRYLAMFGSPVGGELAALAAQRVQRSGHLVVTGATAITGAAGVAEVPYLAEHFGVPFRHIGPVVTADPEPGLRAPIVSELLAEIVAEPDGGVPRLDVLRVEADDLGCYHAAIANGFLPYETTLTWVNDLERVHLNPPKTSWPDIEVMRIGIDEAPSEDALAGLRGGGALIAGDHYHNDPRLDSARAASLYERWLDRGLKGDGSDVAVLRYHEGALIGIGLWTKWRDLEPFGVSMVGNGFGFRAGWAPPGTTQDFSSIVCNRPLLDNRLLEWSTQATNYPMANMISREPSIRLCRTSHVLHRWSDHP
ncbi:hypothetical protein [Aquihabitans sp. McL0605]|uniref:hypothetical protein n=1 Tax=Aquihabitans sp. McL0605 TaxID=3415671 RepID=UPI003CF24946